MNEEDLEAKAQFYLDNVSDLRWVSGLHNGRVYTIVTGTTRKGLIYLDSTPLAHEIGRQWCIRHHERITAQKEGKDV